MGTLLKRIIKTVTYGFFVVATFSVGLLYGGNSSKIIKGLSLPSVPTAHADGPIVVGEGGGSGEGSVGCVGSGEGSGSGGEGGGGEGGGGSGDGSDGSGGEGGGGEGGGGGG